MVRKLIVVVGFAFFITAVAYAEPPKLIKGYGLTEWGQSVEQVKKLVPNLKEVTLVDYSEDFISEYAAPAQEPFKEIQYWFADNKLFKVELILSDRVKKEVGESFVGNLIRQKYQENKETKDLLIKERVRVYATRYSDRGFVIGYVKDDILNFAREKAQKEEEMKRQETAKELRLEDLL